jgi:hypothetical protein
MSNIETSLSAGESTGTDLASGLDQNGSTDQQPTTAPEITKTGAEATDQRHLPVQKSRRQNSIKQKVPPIL